MNHYQDIINLDHYELRNHVRMPMEHRSAQFAPYQSLNGYSDGIYETGRFVSSKRELMEEEKEKINQVLQNIQKKIRFSPHIKVIYFEKDLLKEGGEYKEYIGKVKKIIENKKILFQENKEIKLEDILHITLQENFEL